MTIKLRGFSFKSGMLLFLGGLFCLSACSAVLPFVDARREAGYVKTVGSSTNDKPVICYGLFGSQEEIDALASNECAKTGRKAVFEKKESFACYLFTPQKAVYSCQKTTDPIPPYQSACLIAR